jgi:hypothetical protein
MVGDDRVRYCDQCKLNVYNFSAMSLSEIEHLRVTSTAGVCGRLYRRLDGTILTKDCPVGFRARVWRVSRIAGAALAAMMSAVSATAQNPGERSSTFLAVAGTAGMKLTIVDPSGAVIPRASIVISDQTGAQVAHGETDNIGSYQTLDLRSGSWKIKVSSPGFEQWEMFLSLRDREVFQSVIKLEVAATTMGFIVNVDDLAVPPESDLPGSAFPMPNYIPFVQTAPDAVLPPSKPSHNPVSRLLRKLHF